MQYTKCVLYYVHDMTHDVLHQTNVCMCYTLQNLFIIMNIVCMCAPKNILMSLEQVSIPGQKWEGGNY